MKFDISRSEGSTMTLATDNITLQGDNEEAPQQHSLNLPDRQFTGRSAYEYKDKLGKTRRVAEDVFEQWLWNRLTSLANTVMNAERYEAVCVDETTGEVSAPAWTTLSAQSLTQRLLDLVHAEAADRLTVEQQGSSKKNPNTITVEHLHSMVERIVQHQHSSWDATWVDHVRERASINGKKSKRPKDNTVFQVLGFPFADHSAPEAKAVIAKALGKSVRTVERRLEDYRKAPAVWVPTSGSRYLSQPVKAPTSTPRYLSRGDQLMALPYDERPRTVSTEPVDWTYLLDVPEPQQAQAEEQTMTDMDIQPEWNTSSLLWMTAEYTPIGDNDSTSELQAWMERELSAA